MCKDCVDGIIPTYRLVGKHWVCIGTEPCPDLAKATESGPSLCQYCHKTPAAEGSVFCGPDCLVSSSRVYVAKSSILPRRVKFPPPEGGWKHGESINKIVGKYRVVVMPLFGRITHTVRPLESPQSHKPRHNFTIIEVRPLPGWVEDRDEF